MLRFLFGILCLVSFEAGFSQPVLNNRYDLNRPAAIFGSVVSTDSCFYILGTTVDTPDVSKTRSAFMRVDFDGEISTLFILEDSVRNIRTSAHNNLTPTFDGNFATVGSYTKPYSGAYLFIKFSPLGDTICTKPIFHFLNDGKTSIRPSAIKQNPDSTFICLAWVQDTLDYKVQIAMFRLTKDGNMSWYQYLTADVGGYPNFQPGDLEFNPGGGFLVSGVMFNATGSSTPPAEDQRYHIKLVKTDDSGNEEWSKIYYENDINYMGRGLTLTIDNGYLFCGLYGQYNSGAGGIEYKGHIIKLNNDFSLDWEQIFGYAWASDQFEFFEILPVTDSTFVAVGRTVLSGVNSAGHLVKFNLDGDILWESEIIKVPWVSGEIPTEHVFYDVKQTPDNGFIMVGEAVNYESTYEPLGQHGWVVKTDSFGCLVPNCQDVLQLDPIEYPAVIKPYPNPVQNELNLFYHDTKFTGGAELVLVDMHGQEINRWKLLGNDLTYMIDVSPLESGMYLLQLQEKGEIRLLEKILKE
jgi:hypothetical protein